MKVDPWQVDDKTGVASTTVWLEGCPHPIEYKLLLDSVLLNENHHLDRDDIANALGEKVEQAQAEHALLCAQKNS